MFGERIAGRVLERDREMRRDKSAAKENKNNNKFTKLKMSVRMIIYCFRLNCVYPSLKAFQIDSK